jgi:hypothetical protein
MFEEHGVSGTCPECGEMLFHCLPCVNSHHSTRTHRQHKTKGNTHLEKVEAWQAATNPGVTVEVDDPQDMSFIETDNDFEVHLDSESPLGKPPTSFEQLRDDCGFAFGSKSPSYYWHEHHNPGEGAKRLIAKAFGVPPESLTKEELLFHLKMAKFLNGLSTDQIEQLDHLLLPIANFMNPNLTMFQATRPPLSRKDFDEHCLKKKNSLLPNLPQPVVMKTEDGGHAYLGLIDVLANMLANKTEFDEFHYSSDTADPAWVPVTTPVSVTGTHAAHELHTSLHSEADNEHTMCLWAKTWLDDFDPGHTKKSRNQVFAWTFTFCPKPDDKTGSNTVIVGISGKGEDHDVLEELFGEELKILRTDGQMFYQGATKKLVLVKMGIVGASVDRPARTALLRVGDHNGKHSCLWGHAVHIDDQCKENCLPSCASCRGRRLKDCLQASIPHAFIGQGGVGSVDAMDEDQGNVVEDNLVQDENTVSCNTCSSWDVTDDKFSFRASSDYPQRCDSSEGAPKPPIGREVPAPPGGKLKAVKLTIDWLIDALTFAHHQMKETPPGARNRNSRFWTKKNLEAYLGSCAINKRLQNEVYELAKNDPEKPVPIPAIWNYHEVLKRCHWAPMHTANLGQIKSDIEIDLKWLSNYQLQATFGKQANTYLKDIKKLRCSTYFDAQPFSTSKWGTGTWVSDNYAFFGRTRKFWCLLPCLNPTGRRSNNDKYLRELRGFYRFNAAAAAALSCVYSDERDIPNMDAILKLYLDALFEMDHTILGVSDGGQEETEPNRGRTKKGKLNFAKSVSLAALGVNEAHKYFGPARLYHEGGWPGERKIQQPKAFLHVKRSTADWSRIVLHGVNREEALEGLLASILKTKREGRKIGEVYVFGNSEDVESALQNPQPMSGVLLNGQLWLAHRPVMKEDQDQWFSSESAPLGMATRSAVNLKPIVLNDSQGVHFRNLCWCAPIETINDNEEDNEEDHKSYYTLVELDKDVEQHCLLLPRMEISGKDEVCVNSYYVVGDKWTERVRTGEFVRSPITQDIFSDWLLESE